MSFTPLPNEVYTTFSFLGFIMCIIPLPWHLKGQELHSFHLVVKGLFYFFPAWNAGTCLYMFWTGIGCLIFFVNSIVWHGNAFNPAPIWCDICKLLFIHEPCLISINPTGVKIIIGTSTGIPASSLCINRRLYLLQLNPAGNVAITNADKIRSLATDLGISLGLPTLLMILRNIFVIFMYVTTCSSKPIQTIVYQGHRFNILEDIGCFQTTYNTWVAIS
jgi:pheromone a factor receptor